MFDTAKDFWEKVRLRLEKMDPQLKLFRDIF